MMVLEYRKGREFESLLKFVTCFFHFVFLNFCNNSHIESLIWPILFSVELNFISRIIFHFKS
jgi:hypothetical protein